MFTKVSPTTILHALPVAMMLLITAAFLGCKSPGPTAYPAAPLPEMLTALPRPARMVCRYDPNLDRGRINVWSLPGTGMPDPDSGGGGFRGVDIGTIGNCEPVRLTGSYWDAYEGTYWVEIEHNELVGWLMFRFISTEVVEAAPTPRPTAALPSPPSPRPTLQPTLTALSTPDAASASLRGHVVYVAAEDEYVNGRLVMADSANLYRSDLETGKSTQLTTGIWRDSDPVWSPDGDRIAFVSDRRGNNDLYVIDENGGHLMQLTDTPEEESHPTWSPDGARIAFARFSVTADGLREGHLHVVSLGDRSEVALAESADYSDFHPDWSPDGRYLAFTRDGVVEEPGQQLFGPFIFLYDFSDSSFIRLTAGRYEPAWQTLAEPAQFIVFENPTWLPQAGASRLSMEQRPGMYGGVTVVVCDLQWQGVRPELRKVVAINEGLSHTWNAEGEWIIFSAPNGQQTDLSATLVGPRAAPPQLTLTNLARQVSPFISLDEATWLTQTDAFEYTPDWKP